MASYRPPETVVDGATGHEWLDGGVVVRTVWRLGDTGQALSISLPGTETATADRPADVVTTVGPRRSE